MAYTCHLKGCFGAIFISILTLPHYVTEILLKVAFNTKTKSIKNKMDTCHL